MCSMVAFPEATGTTTRTSLSIGHNMHPVCATIVHRTNMMLTTQNGKHLDLYTIDAKNAFNQVDRLEGLMQVAHLDRGCLPFIRAMYLEDSASAFYGCADGVRTVHSRAGFHQGDVLGSLLFCIAVQPLINHICASVAQHFPDAVSSHEVCVNFYVDDGTFVAPHAVMMHIIELLQNAELQARYGYVLNPSKGAYLMGKCEHTHDADQRLQSLLNLGLSPDIIRVHPDNELAANEDINDEAHRLLFESRYGAKVLGSYVGTDAYISANLREYAEELAVVRARLDKINNAQCRLLLFRKSFCCKPLHIFRTIKPAIAKVFAREVEDSKKGFIVTMLNLHPNDLTDDVYEMMSRPIQGGGLGFYDVQLVASAAYVSSLLRCLKGIFNPQALLQMLLQQPDQLHSLCGTVATFQAAIADLKIHEDQETAYRTLLNLSYDKNLGTVQAQLMDHVMDRRLPALQEKLCSMTVDTNTHGRLHNVPHMNRARLYFFNSLRNKEAGAWLQATPKNHYLTIGNKEMEVAIRHRYFLPQSCIRPSTKCACNGRPVVDRFGHHYIQGCGMYGFRTRSHNLLAHQLTVLLRYLGMDCKREETGRFTDIDPNDAHRPDVTVYNPPMEDHLFPIRTAPVVIDVSVASAIRGAGKAQFVPMSEMSSMRPGIHAEARAREKIAKYQRLDPNNTVHFVPFVLESSGYLHKTARDFVSLCVRKASDVLTIPSESLYSYAVKCLSVTFQRCIATNILQHSYAAAVKSTDIILQKDPGFRDSQIIGDSLRD